MTISMLNSVNNSRARANSYVTEKIEMNDCNKMSSSNHVTDGVRSTKPDVGVGADLMVIPLPSLAQKYAKMVIPHVGLAVLCAIYILLGALAFYYVERPHEEALRKKNLAEILEARRMFLESLWAVSEYNENRTQHDMPYDLWVDMVDKQLDNISLKLFNWYSNTSEQHPPSANSTNVNWSFPAAIFFAASTVATIGYGNLTPVTRHGRIMCVVFGLFGVPLMLVTIADLGKFIGDGILLVYGRYRAYKQKLCHHLHRTCSMYSTSSSTSSHSTSSNGTTTQEDELFADFGLPDEMGEPVPVLWVTVIIVSYMALGGYILPLWESEWTFMDAFYFSFVTMSTVGFGDFVPKNELYFWLTLPYIVLGLAITTMCVDLVGSVYIVKIHRFGQKMHSLQSRMKTIGDMMAYQRFLRREYGISQQDIDRMPLDGINWSMYTKPYRPRDIDRIYFIDQRTNDTSMHGSMQAVAKNSMSYIKDDDDEEYPRDVL